MITMYDSIDVSQIPADAAAVAGYVGGDFHTLPELQSRFPHALLLSIAINAGEDAACLDVETGDASAADIPSWQERQRGRGVARPCIYANASTMESLVLPVLASAKIARASVRLWSAHYTASAHICGPMSCKAVSVAMDGCQWTKTALGRNLDQSLLVADFFAVPAPPAAKPTVVQHGPYRHTAAAGSTLGQIAQARNTTPAHLVQVTTAALSPADVEALAKLPLPAGWVFYTSNP